MPDMSSVGISWGRPMAPTSARKHDRGLGLVKEMRAGVLKLMRHLQSVASAMHSCHQRECTAWTPPEGQARWADGCDHVFLDIGANRGVSIRKLFEPEAYPTAGYDWDNAGLPRWLLGKNRTAPRDHMFYAPLFDEHFGANRASNNFGRICAFGFEPNPQHTPRLQALERCYTQRGWRVKIFTETAVSDIDGNTTLDIATHAANALMQSVAGGRP